MTFYPSVFYSFSTWLNCCEIYSKIRFLPIVFIHKSARRVSPLLNWPSDATCENR